MFSIFPWVLDALNVSAYHLFKVIELVVRAEPEFPREIVKHMNAVEEACLEELTWKSRSPLWDTINLCLNQLPSCEQVCSVTYD